MVMSRGKLTDRSDAHRPSFEEFFQLNLSKRLSIGLRYLASADAHRWSPFIPWAQGETTSTLVSPMLVR